MAAAVLAAIALVASGFALRGVVDQNDVAQAPLETRNASSGTGGGTGTDDLPAGVTPTVPADGSEPVADVAAAVAPAVVQIQSGSALGSGFIYDASGLIMTNAHVVGSQRTVRVTLADESTYEGDVLGADPSTDVAVVQIRAERDLPVVRMAPEPPQVGQMAVALGSPFGLEQTVTAGIVSALDRPVANDAGVAVNMIQTDAPINPGNSGGVLANRSGEVIGINTSIFSRSGENSGIGFAIPIGVAERVADQLARGQAVQRAQLGVRGGPATASGQGVVIASVEAGGGAEAAGLRAGDVIVSVDGDQIQTMTELSGKIGSYRPGERITLVYARDGQTHEVEVTLGSTG